MDLRGIFLDLGVALGLGLLVGLQRQRAASGVAGIRTFPLITLLGALAALMSIAVGGWIVGAGLGALAALLVISNLFKIQSGRNDPGITTEVAALLMYAVGAAVMLGYQAPAVAIGGVTAILLHLKGPLHRLAERMKDADVHAVMRFALISLVILPVLPSETYGPYDVLNPRKIWLMVVLIVGIGLAGYVAYKLFGSRAGALLGGVLGGLISSTATTVSFARRTRNTPETASLAALVIVIASAVSVARVIVEAAVVAPHHTRAMLPPLGAMLGVMVAVAGAWYFFGRGDNVGLPEPRNPAELKPALIFALLYAVIVLAVAAARQHFDSRGLYAVAALSGLTDMDAITLSTADLVKHGRLDARTGWRAILLASLANLVFKGGAAMVLGARALSLRVAVLFGVALAGGLAIFFLWP